MENGKLTGVNQKRELPFSKSFAPKRIAKIAPNVPSEKILVMDGRIGGNNHLLIFKAESIYGYQKKIENNP